MAKKKDRAFFTCPRWSELAPPGSAATGVITRVPDKTLAAIAEGRPVARSTLRKALIAACRVSGSMIDVDHYIVDQRATRSPA